MDENGDESGEVAGEAPVEKLNRIGTREGMSPASLKALEENRYKGQFGQRDAQEEPEEVEDELPAGRDDQLADMRHVYNRPAGDDCSQGQRTCRAWLKEDRKGFMHAKTRLEAQVLDRPKGRGNEPDDAPVKDGGTSLVMNLLREGIAADRAKEAEENAKEAARPDAASIGAARQATLRAALWRERQLIERRHELERDREGPKNEKLWRELDEELYGSRRVTHTELALDPNPGNSIVSLEKAIQSTEEHEAVFRKDVAKIEAELEGKRNQPKGSK